MNLAFGRDCRVRQAREYQDLQRGGRKVFAPHFFLVYLRRPATGLRIGLIVSRKVGKAHDRNRVKRWVREYFRTRREAMAARLGPEGFDFAVAARKGAAELDHSRVDAEMDDLFRRLAVELARKPRPPLDRAPDRKTQ